jgi:hypothetical protein
MQAIGLATNAEIRATVKRVVDELRKAGIDVTSQVGLCLHESGAMRANS